MKLNLDAFKFIVVGAGFFGATIAERIAEELDEKVLVVEKRNHIGGNSFSDFDADSGIEVHKYGSHIFHTKSVIVWKYINRFTAFNSYRHKVLTKCGGNVFFMPVNLFTINSFYGKTFTPKQAREFIKTETEGIHNPSNFEEMAISSIGKPMYEAFIKGYTKKQWGVEPSKLPSGIMSRLPVKFSYDGSYFDDPWQGIPVSGYGGLFKKMLSHRNIILLLETDYSEIKHKIKDDCIVIYSGPIDRYFDYKFGKLGFRTSRFEKEIIKTGDFQGTSVMNYADSKIAFTRIHEFRHFHPERIYPDNLTVIYREYSKDTGFSDDPYYPVNTAENNKLYSLYKEEAKKANVIFGGRLGAYQYINMDRAVELALLTFDERIKPLKHN